MPPDMRAEWLGEDLRDGTTGDRDAADLEAERVASDRWGRDL